MEHIATQQLVASAAAPWPGTSAFLQRSVPFDQIMVFALGGVPELWRWTVSVAASPARSHNEHHL
jgi:hypothetical protein